MGLAQNAVVQMAQLLQIVTLLKEDVGGGKQNVDVLGAPGGGGGEGILGSFWNLLLVLWDTYASCQSEWLTSLKKVVKEVVTAQ